MIKSALSLRITYISDRPFLMCFLNRIAFCPISRMSSAHDKLMMEKRRIVVYDDVLSSSPPKKPKTKRQRKSKQEATDEDLSLTTEEQHTSVTVHDYAYDMSYYPSVYTAIPPAPRINGKIQELCRFFKSGSCHKGDMCNFSHDTKLDACVFFHWKGGCQKGDTCPFSHGPMTPSQYMKLCKELQDYRIKFAQQALDASAHVKHTTNDQDPKVEESEQPSATQVLSFQDLLDM